MSIPVEGPIAWNFAYAGGRSEWLDTDQRERKPNRRQIAGDNTQLKGRIRRSRVLDAFPCQPQLGLVQDRFSSPNSSIASVSESDLLLHFIWKLILWRPFGHSKTIRYAKLISYCSIPAPIAFEFLE
jgi:hypothetical protein